MAKGEHLKLDAEGGAEVTTPRTRYLTTGIAVILAASHASPDRDAGKAPQVLAKLETLLRMECQDSVFWEWF